jgi:FlaA1/EpsC-like NDP-sugar epimerase/UDP-N-acetylmuramyl pentapeptide phosphotransferase/UDP-N-acetylglucosamine-1-phosphate transferase
VPVAVATVLCAFAATYLIVAGFRLWAEKRNILDVPNPRSAHRVPVPRGAGLAIAAVTVVGAWLALETQGPASLRSALLAYALGALLVASVSWLDDLRSLPTWVRFAVHCVAAVFVLFTVGSWRLVTLPLLGTVDLGWAGPVATFLWIVGLTNAYNFMDGADGLAGVQAVVAGLGWAVLGHWTDHPLIALFGLIVAASSLAFLCHNWPPARVFMGDVGSAFLGYTFAVLPLLHAAAAPREAATAPLHALLLVWPFVFDSGATFLVRLARRERVLEPHRTHLYQRLMAAGWGAAAVATLYGTLGVAGMVVARLWEPTHAGLGTAGLVALPVFAAGLWGLVTLEERRSGRAVALQQYVLRYRKLIIVLSQLVLLIGVYLSAFLLRLDFDLSEPYASVFLRTLPIVLAIKLLVFSRFGLFSGWWRYAGMSDLLDILKAVAVSAPLVMVAVPLLHGLVFYPRSVFLADPILTVLVVGGARFAVRAYHESARLSLAHPNTLIVGAGAAGAAIARELKANRALEYTAVGFVDDDPSKWGVKIQGIKVRGGVADLPRLIAELEVAHIMIAMPSATGAQIQHIIDTCQACAVDFQTVPALADLLNGRASVGEIRKVRVEDLLARKPVQLDLARIQAKLGNRVVLVTGAGGSIGSELVRRIAEFGPQKLVMVDRAESDLHQVELDLAERAPSVESVPVVGDILDVRRLREVFAEHRPHTVFHAAAYKHVPMMERHCFEAVTNNVFGTYNVAVVARQSGAQEFVLISSDKAVNPTSVMGVTKRVAELVVLGMPPQRTRFSAVRFGNVLGSRGSVLPLFEQQIARRKPITITHPEARRYFMTVSEAVQLVLQTSTMSRGGEIFMLDMGEPVAIVDLARNLIRLSGLEPERDVPIVFTGLRPGEKLFEELRIDGEGVKPTSHPKVCIVEPVWVAFNQVEPWLDELGTLVDSRSVHGLVQKLQEIVPEYTPGQELLSLTEVDRFDKSAAYARARLDATRDAAS